MDETGFKAIFEDAEFQKGLARYIAGSLKLKQETENTANAVSKSGDKIKKGLDLGNVASSLGRVPSIAGITDDFAKVTHTSSQAVNGIESVISAFKGLPPQIGCNAR